MLDLIIYRKKTELLNETFNPVLECIGANMPACRGLSVAVCVNAFGS